MHLTNDFMVLLGLAATAQAFLAPAPDSQPQNVTETAPRLSKRIPGLPYNVSPKFWDDSVPPSHYQNHDADMKFELMYCNKPFDPIFKNSPGDCTYFAGSIANVSTIFPLFSLCLVLSLINTTGVFANARTIALRHIQHSNAESFLFRTRAACGTYSSARRVFWQAPAASRRSWASTPIGKATAHHRGPRPSRSAHFPTICACTTGYTTSPRIQSRSSVSTTHKILLIH